MNFLAHVFLSRHDRELLLGNFLGDLIRPAELPTLDARVQEGVRLHRAIDRFTDHHPLVRTAVARIRSDHGKYAPVVVDVWFDFLLIRHWSVACPEEAFGAFRRRAYAQLRASLDQVPPRLRDRVRGMIRADWLAVYGTVLGLNDTFQRLEQRTSRPDLLHGVLRTLDRELPTLDAEFPAFWADLVVFVARWEDVRA